MIKNYLPLAAALTVAACGRARAAPPEARQGVVELDDRALGFEVPGRLREMAVARGQVVRAGEVLARLDDGLEKPVREARAAEVRAAEAQLALVRAGSRPEDVSATRAQLAGAKQAETIAKRNFDRVKKLSDDGAITPAALDDAANAVAAAEAQREVLEQRLRLAKAGARREEIDAAEAKVASAKAALAAEDERLARFTLTAPVDGTVLDVNVDPGEVVSAGLPVVTVADTHHPYIDVFVPEGALDGVRTGASAEVRVDGVADAFAAAIEDVGRTTEFTPRYLFSERERPNLVVRVRVRIDDRDARLHAGVPAFVTIGGGGAVRAATR